VAGMMEVLVGASVVVEDLLAIALGHMEAPHVARMMEVLVGTSVVVMALHQGLLLPHLLGHLQLLPHLALNGARLLPTLQ